MGREVPLRHQSRREDNLGSADKGRRARHDAGHSDSRFGQVQDSLRTHRSPEREVTGPGESAYVILKPCRNLNKSELKALDLAANGYGSREAAKAMGMTEAYVKNLWHTAAQALGADNRVQAVAMAIRRKLID